MDKTIVSQLAPFVLGDYELVPDSIELIQLYTVLEENIEKAELRTGLSFPTPMKEFWRELGCGFITQSLDGSRQTDQVNLMMGPLTVVDAIFSEGIYGLAPVEEGLIPFFDTGDSNLIALKATPDGGWEVVTAYSSTPIRPSLDAFLKDLLVDPEFYLDVQSANYRIQHPDYKGELP
jgi:hypothetical protein